MKTTVHIRDRATGRFYKGLTYLAGGGSEFNYAKKGTGKRLKSLTQAKVHLNYLLGVFSPGPTYRRLEDELRILDGKVSRKRDIDDLARQMAIYTAINPGYFSGSSGYLSNPFPVEAFPATWEFVEKRVDVEKAIPDQLLPLDFDLAAFAAKAARMRRLTDCFGSAVRQLYVKIEDKGALDRFEHVCLITPDFDGMTVAAIERVRFASAGRTVETALKEMSIKRTDCLRVSERATTAIAFRTLAQTIQFQIGFAGPGKVKVIDMARVARHDPPDILENGDAE